MKTITDYRKEATLNMKLNYPEGIMTRKEWIELKKNEGWRAEERTVRNHVAEEKLEEWIYNNRDMNSGNPNWPATKKWLSKKDELKAGIFKTEYHIQKDNSLYEITKTEYDYFKQLERKEDLDFIRSYNDAKEQIKIKNLMDAGLSVSEAEIHLMLETDLQKSIL